MTDLAAKEDRNCTEYAYGQVPWQDLKDQGKWECRKLKGSWKHESNDGFIKTSKLIVILVQLLFWPSYSYGHGLYASNVDAIAGRQGQGRSMLQVSDSPRSNPNCTKTYTVATGDTCASVRLSQNLSQAQLLQLDPELDCKTLKVGQAVCVQGIPESCSRTIVVKQGPATSSCVSIAAAEGLSLEGFFILNPGIGCPDSAENNNSWSSSRVVCVAPGLGRIFIEYMGASGNPITFNDVQPLVQSYSNVVYYVALAFAIDTDANGTLQNGTFTPYWSSTLDPLSAQAFRTEFPEARILVSLGGASQFINETLTVDVIWEDPPNAEEWIANAQSSLTSIAVSYSIDGIDIDYENFPTTHSSFAYCIGTLISRLKGNNTIGIATIAPFGEILPEYLTLMREYGDFIDYVNFQFYAYQLHSVASYVQEFNTAAALFPPWKLLASTQINGTNSIAGPMFLDALVQLEQSRGLPGVMLWEADNSLSIDFADEKGILALLSGQRTRAFAPAPAPGPPSPFATSPPGPNLAPAAASESSSIAPAGAPVPQPAMSSGPEGLLGSGWRWRSYARQWSRQPGFVLLTTAVGLLLHKL